MRRRHRFLWGAAVLMAVSCNAPQRAPSPGDALHAQLAEDWQYWMAQYPEVATELGYPGHDDRWTDYSAAAIDARAAHLRTSRDRLLVLDRAALDSADQTHFDLYRELLDTAVRGLDFQYDAMPIRTVFPQNLLMPLTQMAGVQQGIPRTIALMPSATLEHYRNIVARLERVGPLVDQTIALMERGVAAGLTPPRVTLRDVPAQVAAQIVDEPLTSPMLAAFREWPAAIPADDRSALTARAVAAYNDAVAPAFRRLHEFLTVRYIPRCRETVAAAALPDGAAMYRYNVAWHTTTDLTPQQIHDIGLAEVRRIREDMDRVQAAAGFTGTFEQFVAFLRTDPRFYFTEPAALLTAYRDVAKRADPELARLFGVLPRTPYGVKPVPDAIAPSQTTAYYDPGSLAAGRPGVMYANTYMLNARPKWEMEALTLHEAVPGHHLQVSLAQERGDLPDFRRHSSYTAYVEGWGLYAESLGEEMGFYTDPYAKFGQLTYEMWRAVRLVIDTGLHAMGWPRDRAIEYFRSNAPKTEQDIIVEVDRYIVWPGQALGYKMGQLKIRELRSQAERRLGARFSVRQFHDVVLREGAVPLDRLARQVDDWNGQPAASH
jgi:uncharacterized protein (DUF885 family)